MITPTLRRGLAAACVAWTCVTGLWLASSLWYLPLLAALCLLLGGRPSNSPETLRLTASGRWRARWTDGRRRDVKLTLSWISPGGRWAGLQFESDSMPALRVLLSAKRMRSPQWRRLLVRLRYAA